MMLNLDSMSLRFEYHAENVNPEILKLSILDQTLLPLKEEWVFITSVDQAISTIQNLQVRGAPLIGVFAALSLAMSALKGATPNQLIKEVDALCDARPTAINLINCMERMRKTINKNILQEKINELPVALLESATHLFNEDRQLCEVISLHGSELIQSGDTILTHCNTGGLATTGVGTALGVIRKAHEQGKSLHVYVDETRPLLQGARLTTWELQKLKIPYTLITDSMAGALMKSKKINKVFVGCDRIAVNGDFANKIGTYGLSVLATFHKIPFYVVGPYTTIDWSCMNGDEIPIEQRCDEEVLGVEGTFGQIKWAPKGSPVYNPAFDVTPAEQVSKWILNYGIFDKKDFDNGRVKICTQS